MNLVIVESPAKAKTIEKFLGKDYVVKSSYGHVRDLASKGISVDVENGFEPKYEVMKDKKTVLKELKAEVKKAETIWLATDEDREGEAISWHLYETLELQKKQTKRIVFNEITKPAILKAVENPRSIDLNLVDAQQARRVLDRLVGFELSPVLWRKVQPKLSAGRVQSVTVRLIVEREKEIQAFTSTASYRVVADFIVGDKSLKAELNTRFASEQEATEYLKAIANDTFTVNDISKKPLKRKPAAPFTTSTLQQEASRKLGFSVSQTMSVAQRLYEAGHITYMRTDSVNLSDTAINGAKAEVTKSYGSEFVQVRNFATKSKGAQEAHEAIRPTYFENHTAGETAQEKKLYDLIWKRTVASQMADAELEKTTVSIGSTQRKELFKATGEVIKFEGFLKVYIESTDDESDEENSGLIPPISVGEVLKYSAIKATERFSNHPPRYTEASLVKKLEELGIGRPSTYAATISTIQKRNYVVKEDREGTPRNYQELVLENGSVSSHTKTEISGAEKKKLFPTDIGIVVNDFLIDHFAKIMDYNFTASVEKEFDDIASGDIKWNEMIDKFYQPFHSNIDDTLKNSERATGERLLGVDPKTQKNVYARIGRFGPMVQMGETENEEKPQFASLSPNQQIGTITLEEALELFKLPRTVGEYEGEQIVANVGRYGPYIKIGKTFISIKEHDPLSITLDESIEYIKAKKAEGSNVIAEFKDGEVRVLNGRYGPYISFKRKNYKIPKGTEPKELTEEDCMKIIEAGPTKRGGAKKTTK